MLVVESLYIDRVTNAFIFIPEANGSTRYGARTKCPPFRSHNSEMDCCCCCCCFVVVLLLCAI